MDDFFRIVSKAVIIFPIVVIIIALILKYNQQPQQIKKQDNFLKPTIIITPTLAKKKINIDFQGPLICQYQEDNLKATIYIKNRNINLELNSKGLIKKYNLTSYLPFIEMILVNNNQDNINNILKTYTSKDLDIEKLLENCQKKDF